MKLGGKVSKDMQRRRKAVNKEFQKRKKETRQGLKKLFKGELK